MGWVVGVRWCSIPIAFCGEIGCDWQGTLGLSEIAATREADDHWRWHSEQYAKEQEALDAQGQ